MKKLLFVLCAAMAMLFTGCEAKEEVSAHVNFVIKSDCSAEGIVKIENLMKEKGLLLGNNITVTAEGGKEKDIEIRVQQLLFDFLAKVSKEEVNALQTGATYVDYKASYVGFSSSIATSRMTL